MEDKNIADEKLHELSDEYMEKVIGGINIILDPPKDPANGLNAGNNGGKAGA